MKTTSSTSMMSWVWGILSFTLLLSASATEAKVSKRVAKTTEEEPVTLRQSATESTYTVSKNQTWGVGFSTIQNTIPGSSNALTATFDLDRYDAFQALFSMPSTSPFNMGAGLLYKRTISESRGAGFHIGGGFGMADINTAFTTSFLMTLSAIGGFHFEMPGIPHVMVHLDGGPTVVIVNTGGGTTGLQVGALSPALGASIVYLF